MASGDASGGEKTPTASAVPVSGRDDDELSPELANRRRVRYVDDDGADVETGLQLRRTRSAASMYSIHSINSVRPAARVVDPAVALPIHYRTLSFNVQHSIERPTPEAILQQQQQQRKKDAVQELSDVKWHKLSVADLCSELSTSTVAGLTSEGAARKRAEVGPNEPSKPPSRLFSKIFWYFFSGFGPLLFMGCVLVFISWQPLGDPPSQANLALAIVLAVVFAIQAAFNAWQDFSTSRVMNSITGMLPDDCYVLRDGSKRSVAARDIVPGDVLFFTAGSKLPADARFVEATSDARFDRSILTGESLPVGATIDSTDDNYLETRCIGLQGTVCCQGSGVAIVVSTGNNTVFGRIAKLTSTPSTARTTLQKEISSFVTIIVSLMVAMNLIVVGVWAGYIRVQHPGAITVPTLIVDIVSVGIAFVPEGLPIAVTASLTITANLMRKHKILCKSLKTVETLGAVSVLLSDKTGTLTKNQMVATDCLIGSDSMTNSQAKMAYDSDGKPALDQVRAIAALCNAGEFDPTQDHLPAEERKIIGDATDQAVLRFAETLAPVKSLREAWRKRFDLPFNSKNKFAIRLLSPCVSGDKLASETALSPAEASGFDSERDVLLAIKGAPDVLLGRCSHRVSESGERLELDASSRAAIEHAKDFFSSQGKRVILLARKTVALDAIRGDPSDADFDREAARLAAEGLTLVGLIGIVDPPRDEIPEVVETLRRAGIRIMMITGDFKLTALSIAQACGIVTAKNAGDVHGIDDLPRTLPNGVTTAAMAGSSKHKASTTATLPPAASSSIVLSGPELMTLNDAQWKQLMTYPEVVFARTTPEQKLRIVKAYKADGHIVAMTGDGVNDAPSLKEAHIGIAPGSGSDIAIEAADMVLLDSFSAIVQAVLYGRMVFDNLKKTIAYLLPAGSFSEFWPVMTSIIFGLPQILSSFLMIIICCLTDCAAATVLAYEKPEADVMLRRPRNPRHDRLVDWRLLLQVYFFVGIIETVCSFAVSFWYVQRQGIAFSSLWMSYGAFSTPPGMTQDQVAAILNTASSIYFVNLVVMQWFNLFVLRTRRLGFFAHPPLFNSRTQNWFLFPAILFSLAIAFIFCYIPGLQSVIASATVPVEYWFLPVAFGMGLLLLDETRKAWIGRWPDGRVAKIAW